MPQMIVAHSIDSESHHVKPPECMSLANRTLTGSIQQTRQLFDIIPHARRADWLRLALALQTR